MECDGVQFMMPSIQQCLESVREQFRRYFLDHGAFNDESSEETQQNTWHSPVATKYLLRPVIIFVCWPNLD